MALCTRFLTAAVLVAGLRIAPAAYAQHWHGGGNNYHHGGGNATGAAIIGGIIGLGVGAAIASQGYLALPAAALAQPTQSPAPAAPPAAASSDTILDPFLHALARNRLGCHRRTAR